MLTLTLQALVNGLVVGAIYGLIAIGLNLIFGVLRVVNFSHGEFVVLGSYFAYFLLQQLGLNPLLSIALTTIGSFGCSWIVYLIIGQSKLLSLMFNGGPLQSKTKNRRAEPST